MLGFHIAKTLDY